MNSPVPNDPERTQLPPREKFDVAVVNLVLHHIDDTSSFLKGLIGLIKPGGWVVITEFAVDDGGEEFQLEESLHKEIKHGKVSLQFPYVVMAVRSVS